MLEHSIDRATGRWRRRLFLLWIVLTVAVAVYVAVFAPFASWFRDDMWMVGVVVPPLMIILLGTGLLWLLWLATASSRSSGDQGSSVNNR
ncbi:MAG: hypothetical protein IPM60_04265 [Rhodospirillales bacterium]|nr:hypothetical protein [Rhodospirillales bacterium]